VIIIVASIAAILSVPLAGRSLAPLAKLDLRRVWLVWSSIGLQLLITLIPRFPSWLGEPLHLFTFVLSAGFLWSNRRLPGVPCTALGGGLNLAAIAANGGTMPASPWAWHTAGYPALVGNFENSNVVRDAHLWFLGDVFAIPKGWPLANVFSVGDVVIVLAVAYLAHSWCRRSALSTVAGRPSDQLLVEAS
jgi:Family of unknown function (DUF5317)